MEVSGVNGQIVVDESWVTIKRKGAMAMISQGIKGDKRIPISSIISVQFKNANAMVNGYIQFATAGGEGGGGIGQATSDENTVMFKKNQSADFEKLRDHIEELITTKKAKVAFHTLSFLGGESQIAANAAACSADEGKFLQLHKTLFANQPSENSGAWTSSYFSTLGLGLGISSPEYDKCISTNKYKGWVNNVADEGAKRNINSTPTILINGKEIDRETAYSSLAGFMLAIEKA
jgi:protein-disulfide isomerase